MKVYLLKHGEVVTTAEYLGEAEDMQEAKEEFFDCVSSGDTLACCDDNADPLYTDQWGFVGIDGDYIIEEVTLFSNDGSIEGIPESADIYFWSDDNETWYYRNGEEWDGKYDLTPELLEEMLQYPDMEQNIYNTMVEMDTECGYELKPLTPTEYVEMCTDDCDALSAFNFGLELDEDEFLHSEYVWFTCNSPRCSQYLCEYIDEALGNEYFCEVFNERYALCEGKIVRR